MSKKDARSARALSDIQESIKNDELIVICGAGTSIALNTDPSCPNWTDLIKSGVDYLAERRIINDKQSESYYALLASEDIDDALSLSELITRKFERSDAPHKQIWLKETFEGLVPKKNSMFHALKRLSAAGVPIATLNYDTILEEVTGLRTALVNNPPDALGWIKKRDRSILHLHGVWDKAETCVLSSRDYGDALQHEGRAFLQRAISSLNKILFVGCGDTFADPNFQSLIDWIRATHGGLATPHHSLVLDTDYDRRKADPAWAGFVEPLSVGSSHSDVPKFLNKIEIQRATSSPGVETSAHSKVLEAYRSFLVSDCGQMTVEGMRADLDTSQRKFDIEKLFVPLTLSPVPPLFKGNDREKEKQHAEWRAKNPDNQKFGGVLKQSRRIALLALPGGGKTLLTKRVTVAYADRSRLLEGTDELPDLDVTPVLIRCREWKDRIERPLKEIISQIPEFYGENEIGDLFAALEPELNAGRVILIIDGLDEIHDDAARTTFVENIERFLEKYPDIYVMITSREAGFDLVAPCLVRFCDRWRVDALSRGSVSLLSEYWHKLMLGQVPEAVTEAQSVTDSILGQPALRKLSENPLLLTMLLVVKHGNGRLPPDKVTLYERAVEVLLDTWNIKGHAPLNAKEAVPQLAFLAHTLQEDGKQTATIDEVISILHDGRENLPILKRYARDEPSNFVKRVELRSSLLIEGGHKLEDRRTKPFYQFRHLTFQEYLAAVAAVEGHVLTKESDPDLLAILGDRVTVPEWKEVIPMAAVLAKRRGQDLIRRIDSLSKQDLEEVESSGSRPTAGVDDFPQATSILLECFVSEADIPADIVDEALKRIAFFSCGCRSDHDWLSLARGPFGDDLVAQTKILMNDVQDRNFGWFRNTLAVLEAHRRFGLGADDQELSNELLTELRCSDKSDLLSAVLAPAGAKWSGKSTEIFNSREINDAVGRCIFSEDSVISNSAIWAWGFQRFNGSKEFRSPNDQDREVFHFLIERLCNRSSFRDRSDAFALSTLSVMPAKPSLFALDRDNYSKLKQIVEKADQEEDDPDSGYRSAGALTAIHLANDGSDDKWISQMLRKSVNKRPFFSQSARFLREIYDTGDT